MSNSLQSHELQHTRLLCPSLSPWVCSNSYPLCWWCYPTISSSVAHFSSCPHFFPASVFSNESALHIRWPNIVASASVSVLTMNIQGWCPLGLISLISLQSEGLLGVFSSTIQKHCKFTNYFVCLSYFKLSILLKYLIMLVDFLILFMPLWSFLVHVFWDYLLKSQQFQNILIFLMDNSLPICIIILPLFLWELN